MTETLHIYTRVSTAAQAEEGVSLENQRDQGITKAKSLGMEWKIWDEGAASSRHEDFLRRPVLLNLMREIEEGTVKHLFVYNNDRLSRNTSTADTIKNLLIKFDVGLYTPFGDFNWNSPQDRLLKTVLDGIAAYDNFVRTQRSVEGKLRRVAEGYWKGGPPPFGYSIEDRKLVVNEEEAKWVNYIYESYSKGDSIDKIRTELIRNNVISRRGGLFSLGSISKILNNTHYGGYWNYTDTRTEETVRVSCPEIIDPNLILLVKEQKQERSYKTETGHRSGTSNKKYTYLLDDVLWCSCCNCKFYGHTLSKRNSPKQSDYYSCLSKRKKYSSKHKDDFKECEFSRNLRLVETDELVWENMVEVLSQSHLFKEEIKRETLGGRTLNKQTVDAKKIKSQINSIKKDITSLEASLVSVNTNALIGDLTKEQALEVIQGVNQRIGSKKSQLSSLEQQLTEETEGRKWIDWVSRFSNTIEKLQDADALTLEEKKEFLNGIIEKVEVTGVGKNLHSFDIHFRLPYVGDEFIRLPKKSQGNWYSLKDGKNVLNLKEIYLKKTTT